MNYIDLALKLWPLVEKLIALRQANPSITEAEARAELEQAGADLTQKILDDQSGHPSEPLDNRPTNRLVSRHEPRDDRL